MSPTVLDGCACTSISSLSVQYRVKVWEVHLVDKWSGSFCLKKMIFWLKYHQKYKYLREIIIFIRGCKRALNCIQCSVAEFPDNEGFLVYQLHSKTVQWYEDVSLCPSRQESDNQKSDLEVEVIRYKNNRDHSMRRIQCQHCLISVMFITRKREKSVALQDPSFELSLDWEVRMTLTYHWPSSAKAHCSKGSYK